MATRSRTTSRWRATTGDAVLVARRRSVQDAGLLTLAAVVLAVTVLIALAVPSVVLQMADEGVRRSVLDAGPSADVVAVLGGAPGGRSIGMDGRPVRVENASVLVSNAARDMRISLPPELQAVTGPPVTAVQSPPLTARIDDEDVLATRLLHVATTTGREDPVVRWVDGVEPSASVEPTVGTAEPYLVQVGISAAAADRLGLTVGQRLELTGPTRRSPLAVVSGLYEPLDPESPVWSTYPDLLDQVPAPAAAAAVGRVAMLLSDESLPDMMLAIEADRSVSTSTRFPAEPTDLLATDIAAIERATAQLIVVPLPLTGSDGRTPAVQTTLDAVMRTADERLTAATAQTSVLLVGLAVAGALALVLAARLLVVRRETFLLAERARGASIASVALRALVETVPLAAAATVVGALGAWLIVPGGRGTWVVAAVIVVVAALAPAVAASVVVAGAWTGRRLPANRADRERVLGRRRVRRLTAELTLVAVAAAALVSVRSRGLLQTATGSVDLLLAATPVLLAAAATVLVARILPPTLRALSRRSSRGRGIVPIVATARASRTAGTRVPLLTLTISVALVVFCGTTAVTVQRGQDVAADIVVGADVRLQGVLDDADIDALREMPDVTAVAGATTLGERTFGRDSGVKARLVLVDAAELAQILEAHDRPVDPGLATLATAATGGGTPVLITPSLQRTATLVRPEVMGSDEFVDLQVVGTAEHPPVLPSTSSTATVPDGYVVVDRETFAAASGADTAPSTVWVDGPGAAAAVRDAGLADAPGVTVVTRVDWLDTWRTSPLNAGLMVLLVATGVLLAGYAALALVLTVVATSRERGRTLSALRTLGLDARTARAMTFGELAPLALAAVLAGTVIGIGVPWLLTGALGLDLLTGDPGATALQVTWIPVVGAAAVVLVALLAAVAVESAVRKKDRLGEVLRVGER
ncbi:FtsX-like permease family protein [Cellulomonas xylanilytica]|uniref:Membrane protein n=1 Tax=Cellulomonas xylanilytica TaxID=233583 RepID=A0A510V377_9CELL|nr:FtsX-like permease family protein [Cellulomonas xylanilytica]GEK21256.1 membrane protein [Cellulomonas xylanilytica]